MDTNLILLVGLVGAAIFLIILAIAWPMLSREANVERRQKAMLGGSERTRSSGGRGKNDEAAKREQIAQSLKDLEARQAKAKALPLSVRLEQAGVEWSKGTFYVISALIGGGLAAAAYVVTQNPYVALAALPVGGLGIPRFILNFKRNKRVNKFIDEFPNALDVIVRGVKAGLPLGDCIRIIGSEAAEPVRSEFRVVAETQTLGVPMGDAIMAIYDRIPCSEANFFGIVITIQQKAGGNLSEALGNLSRVLRERKKMKAKIKAVSTEAKASAMIIGALPVVVCLMVYLTTPDYISQLFSTQSGHVMLMCSAGLMAVGIFIMRKMINFDI